MLIPVVVACSGCPVGLPCLTSGQTVTLSAKLALWDVTDIREGTPWRAGPYLDHGEGDPLG